jgi:signal transduction histidine kinase/ligand-binding sensor domain-containing protein/DNA-binding response OmpR family regulator
MVKMNILKILLILSVFIFTTSHNIAQTKFDDLHFKQFSTFNGLPNNMVHQVYQDKDGLIWIATFFGLFQYDGYEVRTIKSNLYTPGLLVNNNVLCVKEDLSHRLWIGTHEGLCVLDKQTGDLRKMKLEGVNRHRLNEIHVTTDNKIYLGYIRGMAYYDAQQDTLVLMTKQNCEGEVPERVNIQAFIEDENGDLLIGTWNHGLYRYIIKENRFIHYPLDQQKSILALFKDSKGFIWMGSSGTGLHRATFSADKKILHIDTYKHNPKNQTSICSNYIYSIDEDFQTQSLWLGTRDGLSIMSLNQEGTFINYQDTDSKHYLPVHEVNSVLRDRNGLMWIGTKGAGVFHVDTHARSFHTFHKHDSKALFTDYISTLYVEENGAIWAGYGYGVDYYYGDKTIRVVSTPRPYNISYSASTKEILLTAHDEGVFACREGKVIHQYTAKNCGFIPHNLVHMVSEDHKGNWWLGTYMGLSVRYKDGREYCFNKLNGANELLSKEITCLTEAADGSLWLATNNNGILHVTGNMEQPTSLQCKNYCIENGLLPVNTPLCFLFDKKGRLWAGTEGSGLCLYDLQSDSFHSVHQTYNLPGDMVGSMEEDEQGNLWIGTNQGLARLTLVDRNVAKVRLFTVADGLADNFFNQNASCYRNGRLYFGCSRGIVNFNANIADYNDNDISLCVTDILIDGKSLNLIPMEERRKMTQFTSDFTSKLVIPAVYNNFTIRFASLTYNMPQQNKYAYRLQSFDSDWKYVNADRRSAYYSNLSPGTYIFELRATNENGDWGDVRKMEIVIEPPFWATWWAYLIYFLLILIIMTLILMQARRRLMLRNQLHLQEVETYKVQELNHVKLQFFTNITHELMTPLTIISATLDELKEQMPMFKELYHTMDINVQRLIRLLQQILEFRKAESGNLQLRVAKGDIALFIRHEAESFEPLIRKHQLHFSVVCEQELMEAYFDRDKLDKILYNLLSNAAKYNRKEGFIQLSVKYSQTKGFVLITVKDNGKGISPERQETLFQRFYEGDYRQSHTIGTGIGLSLIRDLVNLHRGSIRVESEVGKGTQFFVEIPIEREVYSDEEIIEIIEETTQKEAIADRTEYERAGVVVPQHDEDTPCILLAEDNEELLSVMIRLLRREYRILQASNGSEALEIIKNEEVDLVVSDVVMPEMDGMELTRQIKTDIEICHIPVILLTAKSAEEDRNEGYTAGADAYLTKPFNLSVLHARIKNLLKAKKRAANDFKKQLAFEIKDFNYTDMDEKYLQNAIDCVNRNLSNPEFDVPQFISEMGTSRTTLHKKLKSLTGLNATGFVRNVRLKAACKIMDENKTIRISELAYAVGFNDPKYFSICFKKEFGIQPTEFMEKYSGALDKESC